MQATEASRKLAHALRERLAIVADEESRRDTDSHMQRLQKISEQISELAANLPEPINPQLRHFLSRCSYSKALEFLEAEMPNEAA